MFNAIEQPLSEFFDGEYLTNGRKYRRSYNGIWTYTRRTQALLRCVISNDLELS